MATEKADSLESRVLKELRRLEGSGRLLPDKYRPWTKSILSALARMGRRLGYRAYTSKGNPKGEWDVGEWLYDLICLKYDRRQYIRAVPLVLESELGTNRQDRIDDFCKLLLARADHRAMIFGARNPRDAEDIIGGLTSKTRCQAMVIRY